MKKGTLTLLTVVVLSLIVVKASAQDGLPPNPDGSKCYVKCVTRDEFREETVKILKRPAYQKLEIVPEEYKTVTETIVTKEASKRYEYIPAVYRTVVETLLVKEPFNQLSIQPAKFSPSSESIQVYPEVARWEMGANAADCPSPNLEDCRVLCWKEYPARYAEIPTQKKDRDETSVPTKIDGQYKYVNRRVVQTPASSNEILVPEETTTVTKRVLVKDQTTRVIEIPAEYETVSKTVLEKKGGLTIWKEMDCNLVEENLIPIYYASGSAELTQASKDVVRDKIFKLMKAEPLVKVQIDSHTDSRGDDASNMTLSQARAASVVNYLVSLGIAKDRLVSRGYGETVLVNRCKNGVTCSETEHRQNRRTTFRVISE